MVSLLRYDEGIIIQPSTQQQKQQRQARTYGNPNQTTPINDHPHAGAIDEFGHYGYVHDPTILKQNPPIFHVSAEEQHDLCAPTGTGPEGGGKLGELIFDHHIQVSTTNNNNPRDVKVFCAVYSHPGNANQTDAIRETWGQRCDGFMVASSQTRHGTATVNIPHQGPYQYLYKGIWQRVRSILAYFHDNFLDDYDFIFLSGDDTYVIMENLKALLASQQMIDHAGGSHYPNPVYLGSWTHPIWFRKNHDYDPKFHYNGGGSGYVSNGCLHILHFF
jgi:hypothetical protein